MTCFLVLGVLVASGLGVRAGFRVGFRVWGLGFEVEG